MQVATIMTLKNPMRMFMHCRRHGDDGGCHYFEWVDESLDERVRSGVGSMVNTETMATKIKKLENDWRLKASVEEIEREKWNVETEAIWMPTKE